MSEVVLKVMEDRQPVFEVPISSATCARSLSEIRAMKVASGSLDGTVGASGVIFSWQNPESNQVIVHEVIIRVATAATLGASMDVGPVANAAATNNTLFDGILVNAVKCESSHDVTASVGLSAVELPVLLDARGGATDWITGVEDGTADPADLVGTYYIFYTEVE